MSEFMKSERPVEPYSTEENPYAWYEISLWEEERADNIRQLMQDVIDKLKDRAEAAEAAIARVKAITVDDIYDIVCSDFKADLVHRLINERMEANR